MGKFYSINPETCSREELLKAIEDCKSTEEYYGSLEQGCKRFINSVYGALACKFYQCSNIDIAESITLQGQDLIKFSVRCFNQLIAKTWKGLDDKHRLIAQDMKEKYPDFDVDKFLKLCKEPVEFGETNQVYGDSCSGDTLISLENGKMMISELFNSGYKCEDFHEGKEYRHSEYKVLCYDGHEVISSNIKWVIRHKTNKSKYRIYISEQEYVEVTGDHSMIIFCDGKTQIIKPSDMKPGMTVMTTEGFCQIYRISEVGKYEYEYVYDIEVDTEDEKCHNFFGNGILIHNTDSISYDSIIKTEKHPEGIFIKDFYEENIGNVGETTTIGHESVHTEDKVLNWDKELYYGNVKRIIRHKVSKPKWRLTTKDGKSIECTDNHSLVVFRDGKEVHVKPCEIERGDRIMEVIDD